MPSFPAHVVDHVCFGRSGGSRHFGVLTSIAAPVIISDVPISAPADWWNGAANDGEFTVYGTYFITYADAAATAYAYDAAGRLLSLTDPEDNATAYEYDALGRVTSETNELDAVRSFVYNAAGQLVRRIDREDRVVVYQYDPLGRNTAEIWYADATDADADQDRLNTITYTYDASGNLLMAMSPLPPGEGQGEGGATYEYTYDSLGRVIEETQTIDGLASEIALSYELSAMGLVEKVSVAIGGVADAVTDYEYDALGRVTKIEQHGVIGGNPVAEKRIDLTYDARSQYAAITRYADLAGTDLVATATYSFDAAYRLVGLDYAKGVSSLATYDYTYDAAGNMLSMTTIDGTADYTLDATNQLTDADYDYQTDESYTYDENGNRTNAGYMTGDNNQLLCDGTYRYEYDAEGNRTLRYIDVNTNEVFDSGDTDATESTWDNRNRLTEVEHFTTWANYDAGTSDQIVEYAYDYQNRLISRTLDSDGTSGATSVKQSVYIYDGDQIVAQFDKTGTGDVASTDMSHRYLWNPQAVDQLFSDEQVHYDGGFVTDELLWALTDHQNSIRDLATYDSGLDETTVATHRVLDAFGNVTSETGAEECLFGYTGKLFDEDTQLQNNINRWYDPAVGKFISVDPISFTAGDSNLYRYVENAPLTRIDPNGLRLIVLEVNTEDDSKKAEWKETDVESSGKIDGETRKVFAYNKTRTQKMIDLLEKLSDNVFNKLVEKGCVSFAGRKFRIGDSGWSSKGDYIARLKRELTSRRETLTSGGLGAVYDKLEEVAKSQTEFYDITVTELHGTKKGKILVGGTTHDASTTLKGLYDSFTKYGKGPFAHVACHITHHTEKARYYISRYKFIVDTNKMTGCISYKPMSFKLKTKEGTHGKWTVHTLKDSIGLRLPKPVTEEIEDIYRSLLPNRE